MVYFWPFGGRDDTSPDSFERALSKLASQIDLATKKLTTLRQRSRRYKALFTLYSIFGYILYAVLVVLLVGYQNIRLYEASGLLGGPLGIYLIRKVLDTYYSRRITSTQNCLEELQFQQRDTIEKLKTVTKYSTTQSLIEKYGGTLASQSVGIPEEEQMKETRSSSIPQGIVRRRLASSHKPSHEASQYSPEKIQHGIIQQQLLAQSNTGWAVPYDHSLPTRQQEAVPGPEPIKIHGQFSSLNHIEPEESVAQKWYDRVLDVIIGEDETSAKHRFALICHNCRMVNGLAPPGTQDIEELEPWGCARCGSMNGENKNIKETTAQKLHMENSNYHLISQLESQGTKKLIDEIDEVAVNNAVEHADSIVTKDKC